jgi:hypothetical protein
MKPELAFVRRYVEVGIEHAEAELRCCPETDGQNKRVAEAKISVLRGVLKCVDRLEPKRILSKTAEDRLMRLEKRALWLTHRITESADQHRRYDFDKAERSALEWAIRTLRVMAPEDEDETEAH